MPRYHELLRRVAEEERTFALALNVTARDPKNAIALLREARDGVHMAACAELGNLTYLARNG